ncbi:MAG: pantetheine-phosphate adenylyltransferase [Elusimicrobiaceae bacterium]|nr:pantetheine-phosphate adenylyltransferase [Elusimicrobiaceae bacterium]
MKPVVFSGSFDPVTNGHLDLIKRARAIFGAVVVVVFHNAQKQTKFTVQERIALLQETLKGEENITVDSAEGLLSDYMQAHGYTTVVRGLRSAHDWNHERTNAYFNKRFYPALETVFLPADEKYQFISSSAVKEAAAYEADIADLVPPCVAKRFKK